MKFCQSHWDALRAAIDARGLSALVAEGGEQATKNLVREITEGPSFDTFDPLMKAHEAIVANSMTFIKERYNQNPLMMFGQDPANPYPECPICLLNWLHAQHDEHCTKPDCDYPKGETYDWMIDRAADDSREYLKQMNAEESGER